MSLRLESAGRPFTAQVVLAIGLFAGLTCSQGILNVQAQEFGAQEYVEPFNSFTPVENQVLTSPVVGTPLIEGQVIAGQIVSQPSITSTSITSEPAIASESAFSSNSSAVIASYQPLAVAKEIKNGEQSLAAKQFGANQTRKTIPSFWRNQAKAGKSMSYPMIRLDAKTRVGELGTGNRFQTLSMVKEIAEDEYLIKAESSVFLFRRFDFSNYVDGRQVPSPGLCEVTGKHDYKDRAGKKQSVLIVEPLAASTLPIPASVVSTNAAVKKTPAITQPGRSSETVGVENQSVVPRESAGAKPVSQQTPVAKRPRFVERVWHTKNKKFSAVGTLVGVGDDIIWLKVKGGSVIRLALDKLTKVDRAHAVNKRLDILQYRRLKKQLEASVIR